MKYCLYCGKALKNGNDVCLKCGKVNETENKYEGFSESKYPNEFYPPVKNKMGKLSLIIKIVSILALVTSVLLLFTAFDIVLLPVSVILLILGSVLISKHKKLGYPKSSALELSKKLTLSALIVTVFGALIFVLRIAVIILALILLTILF